MKKRILFLAAIVCISSSCPPLMGMWLWNKLVRKKASTNSTTQVNSSRHRSLVDDEPAGTIIYKKTLSQRSQAEYVNGCAFFALFRAINIKDDHRAHDKKAFDAWLQHFHQKMILNYFKVSKDAWIERDEHILLQEASVGSKAEVTPDWCVKQSATRYEEKKSKMLQNLHSDIFRASLQESICSHKDHKLCSVASHTLPGQVIIVDSLTELHKATNNWICSNGTLQNDIVQNLRLFKQGKPVAIILNTGEVDNKEGGGIQIRGTHWIALILKTVNGKAKLCIYDSANPDRQRALHDRDPRAKSFKQIYDFWTTQDYKKYNVISTSFGKFQDVFIALNKNRIFRSIRSLASEDNRSLVKDGLAEEKGLLIEHFLIDMLVPAVLAKICGSKLTYQLAHRSLQKKKITITFEQSFLQGRPALKTLQDNGLKQGMIEVRLNKLKSNQTTKTFPDRIEYVLQTLDLLSHIEEIQGYFKNPTDAKFFLSIVETFPTLAQHVNETISCASQQLAQLFTGRHDNIEEHQKFVLLIAIFNADVCSQDSQLSNKSLGLLGTNVLQCLRESPTNS